MTATTARLRPFRRRLALLIAAVFVVGGAALLGVQWLIVQHLLEAQVDEITIETAWEEAVEPLLGEECPGAPPLEAMAQLWPCPEGSSPEVLQGAGDGQTFLVCVDATGQAVSRYPLPSPGEGQVSTVIPEALPEEVAGWQADIVRQVVHESTVRTTTEVSQEVLRSLLWWSVGILGAFALLTACAAWWLSRRSLDPVAAAFERQDRFISGASHELRTPLTTTRTLLEIPLHQGRVPADLTPAVEGALAANARSERLIAALLTLARGTELAAVAPGGDIVDIAGLTRELASERGAEAAEREVSIAVAEVPLQAFATCAPGLAELAIGNLLANAVRHNHPGGRVEVSLGGSSAQVWVEIANDGADLTGTDLAVLREPFHRGDSSRLSDRHSNGDEGLGLGLPLIETAARAGGGHLTLRARPTGGVTARLILPAAG
ncbi:MAG: HAMP domain-containing histidine kinase [Promicromonosporaceae bacterium]|nr:HAMP domain-containing histidine kinase [Promicromonosporaceae bacterium]